MIEFVRSPFWDNWFKNKSVEHSLVICSPYFKKNALDKLIEQFDLDDEESILDVKILIRGKLEDFLDGSSDITALDALLGLRCIDVDNVRRVTNLHMKAFLSDDYNLLVGSGNCTKSGLGFANSLGNVEGGIGTDEQAVISCFNEYFYDVFENAEKLEDFYDDLVQSYTKKIIEPISKNIDTSNYFGNEKSVRYDYRHKKVLTKSNADVAFESISPADIPQFSNFNVVINETLEIIKEENTKGNLVTFKSLGRALPGRISDKDGALNKFGENHAKTAEILGLVTILPQKTRLLKLSPLGETYIASTKEQQNRILARQLVNTNITKAIFTKYDQDPHFDINEFLCNVLAESTAGRRKSNIKVFFTKMSELGIEKADKILKDIF